MKGESHESDRPRQPRWRHVWILLPAFGIFFLIVPFFLMKALSNRGPYPNFKTELGAAGDRAADLAVSGMGGGTHKMPILQWDRRMTIDQTKNTLQNLRHGIDEDEKHLGDAAQNTGALDAARAGIENARTALAALVEAAPTDWDKYKKTLDEAVANAEVMAATLHEQAAAH